MNIFFINRKEVKINNIKFLEEKDSYTFLDTNEQISFKLIWGPAGSPRAHWDLWVRGVGGGHLCSLCCWHSPLKDPHLCD